MERYAARGVYADRVKLTERRKLVQRQLCLQMLPRSARSYFQMHSRLAIGSFALLVCGIVLPVWALWATSRAQRERHWQKACGTILRSEVVFKGEFYEACIEYSYGLRNHIYSGSTVRTNLLLYNWRGPSERLCAQYPVQSAVDVFVDPTDPGKSVLEVGGDSVIVPVSFAVSLGLLFLSLILAFAG
jgi:uncharacterized protein DUF3592